MTDCGGEATRIVKALAQGILLVRSGKNATASQVCEGRISVQSRIPDASGPAPLLRAWSLGG